MVLAGIALGYMQAAPFAYAALFPVLNPLGGAVIFLTYTLELSDQETRHLALRVAINTFFLLAAILVAGSWILHFFGLTVPMVQIGGGLVVAHIGWSLLNQTGGGGQRNPAPEKRSRDFHDLAFFPLTMPLTAGPGCIAVTLTLGAREVGGSLHNLFMNEIATIMGILVASATVFLCYRYANRLTKTLGLAGTQVIMRLFAFLNLCIGLQIVWNGIRAILGLA